MSSFPFVDRRQPLPNLNFDLFSAINMKVFLLMVVLAVISHIEANSLVGKFIKTGSFHSFVTTLGQRVLGNRQSLWHEYMQFPMSNSNFTTLRTLYFLA